jgi:hypothetical protein
MTIKFGWMNLGLLFVLSLSSFSSYSQTILKSSDCLFYGTKEKAPNWVCGSPVDGIDVSAVGSYDKDQEGRAIRKKKAEADAELQLIQMINVHITELVISLYSTSGIDTSKPYFNLALYEAATVETLARAKTYKTAISKSSGRFYALVGFDTNTSYKVANNIVKFLMKCIEVNDPDSWKKMTEIANKNNATNQEFPDKLNLTLGKVSDDSDVPLWKKFLKGKEQDELAADIAKQKLDIAQQNSLPISSPAVTDGVKVDAAYQKPRWINDPGNGVSSSAIKNSRGVEKQKQIAIALGCLELAKQHSVTIQSTGVEIVEVNGKKFESIVVNGKLYVAEDSEYPTLTDVKAEVKAEWRDKDTDELWVWVAPIK